MGVKVKLLQFPGVLAHGRALASEPLCGDAHAWDALPRDELVSIDAEGRVERQALVWNKVADCVSGLTVDTARHECPENA